MIEFALGAMVLAALVCVAAKAITDAFTTARAARAGEWDFIDRQRARSHERWARAWAAVREKRNRQAGGTGDYRPGARAYLGDLYHGFWEDRLAHRQARRALQPPYDPTRPPWHVRLDQAILGKVDRLRGTAPQPTHPAPDHRPVPDPPPTQMPPGDLPPGSWTISPDGDRVPLTEPAPPPAAPDGDPAPQNHPVPAPTALADDISEPASTEGTTMQHDEITSNEALRENLREQQAAAAALADAIAAAEAARARLVAAAAAASDGVSGSRFDAAATAAVREVVDMIGLDTLSAWAQAADDVRALAANGEASLEKYRDAEDQVAAEGIDGKVLEPTAS